MSERPRPPRGKRDAGPQGPREKIYDERIAPLLDEIFALCDEQDIDFVTAFALDDHGDATRIAGSSRVVREDVGCLKVVQAIVSGRAMVMPVDTDVDEVMDAMLGDTKPPGRA